jgi:MFS family permease
VTTSTHSRRSLTALLTADFISILGTRMSMLALPWFVLVTTGSAGKTGLIAFAEMAPYVVVQGLGGPLVDRHGTRRVAIGADLVAAGAFGLVPVIYATGQLSLGVMAALVAVAGAVRGAGDTGRHVLIPGAAEHAGMAIERASGLYDGVSRAAGMIGAPLAGVLIALTSAPVVVAIDAATFVSSAVILIGLVSPSVQPTAPDVDSPTEAGYVASLREGFGHLRGDRLLLGIAVLVLVTNLLDQAMSSVFAPVWSNDVTGSAVALGLMSGTVALGAVLGNALSTWLGPRLPRRLTFAVGFLIGGAPRYFVLAVASSVSPVLAVAFIGGLGIGGINPILGAVEYERVPRHLQTRVLGALGATAWAGIPIGALVGGAMVGGLGLRPALTVAGLAYLLTTLAPFFLPAWRGMDRGSSRTPAQETQARLEDPSNTDIQSTVR